MKSDFFNKNLDVLQAYNPELAERLLKQEIGFYELASGSDGLWNLCYRERRPPVYFYDPLDPAGQVNKYLTKMSDRKNRFLVILGFGLGYPTLQLINRNLKLLKVIIVERDLACLKIAMQCRDLTDLFRHQAVRIIAGCDKNALFVTLYQAIHPYYAGLKEMRFLPWPASILIDKAYYHQVAQTFRQIVDRHFADRGNDPYDTLVAYEHFFANLPELLRHPGARQVKNLFVGQPAIVIATGPSLKKNIHLLNKLDDRAVLLSADASLRILHQDNIRPHLVTTVEMGPRVRRLL